MYNAHVANIIAENAEYFVANLENGGVRLGMFDVCMFDFPADHADYARTKAVDLSDAEALFDEFYARYVPVPTNGYAHLN